MNRFVLTIVVGFLVWVVGSVLSIFYDEMAFSALSTAGMVMVVIGVVYLLRKRKGVHKDELTRRIAEKAAGWSWFITLFVLLVVFWLDHFQVVVLSVKGLIAILYVVLVGTMIGFQQYFWHTGNLDCKRHDRHKTR